jgi:hypothetical protein
MNWKFGSFIVSFPPPRACSSFPRKPSGSSCRRKLASILILALFARSESVAEFRPPQRAADLLLFASPKRSRQEKGDPEIAPGWAGFAAGLRGFPTARPCTGGKLAPFLRAMLRTDPPARRRDLRDTRAKGARAVALGTSFPSMAPSSGGGLGGKARMFEHMDVRVRAGPRPASSAGHRTKSGARAGCPSLWFLSLGHARARGGRNLATSPLRASKAEKPRTGFPLGRRPACPEPVEGRE